MLDRTRKRVEHGSEDVGDKGRGITRGEMEKGIYLQWKACDRVSY